VKSVLAIDPQRNMANALLKDLFLAWGWRWLVVIASFAKGGGRDVQKV